MTGSALMVSCKPCYVNVNFSILKLKVQGFKAVWVYQMFRLTSAPCRTCVQQMSAQSVPPGEENSWRRNRLKMELKSIYFSFYGVTTK